MIDMPDGQLEFGSRFVATKKNDVVSFACLTDDLSIDDISVSTLTGIRNSLREELLVKQTIRGKMEYNSINQLVKLLQSEKLVAPLGQMDDFVLNGRKILFKTSLQNKPGLVHYSCLFAFNFILHADDTVMETYQQNIKNKTLIPSAVLKEMINNNQVSIEPTSFYTPKENGSFYEFLHDLNEDLPAVYQKLKYRQIETGNHYPSELLDGTDLESFKSFVSCINHGFNSSNMFDFKPIDMDIIVIDRRLNYLYHSLSEPEDIEWMLPHLYIDAGDPSRTGSGTIYKENGVWKMTMDIYFKFDFNGAKHKK